MQEVVSAPSAPLYVRLRACKSRGGSVPRVLFASQSSVPAPPEDEGETSIVQLVSLHRVSPQAPRWDVLPQPDIPLG